MIKKLSQIVIIPSHFVIIFLRVVTVYYKLRQVLQSAMDLLQIATGITKGDDYYKLRQYKRVMLHVQSMDYIGRLSNPPQTIAIVYSSGFILWLDFW